MPSPSDGQPHHNLKIIFILHQDNDKRWLYDLFHNADPAGLESRARSRGIELELARAIKQAKDLEAIEHELDELVTAQHQRLSHELDAAVIEYRMTWAPMIASFSDVVTEITGHGWFYEQYVCVVSAFQRGITSWYGNVVAGRYDLKPEMKRWIVAHEIILSHVFHITRKYYTKAELDDWKVWALAEISAVFVKDDKRLRPYWPDSALGGSHFGKSNYPQLGPLELELKAIYDSATSFKEYLDKSVPVLRRFKDTHQ